MLKSTYTVQDGKIKDASNSNDQGTLIPVSGERPSSGELYYSNNVLTGGCLVVGDYEVTFKSDGSVDKTVKGDCSGYNFDEPTSFTPIVYRNNGGTISTTPSNDISSATDLNIGDYVKIGDTDGFYVLRKPISSDENVLLLSEYNISNTASVNETPTWRLDTSSYYDAIQYDSVLFSETFYWKEKFSVGPNCNSTYCPLYADEDVPFVYDSNSNLYAPMENYKNYLETITNLTLSIRPISASEFYAIEDYSWAFNGQVYWTGSAENNDNCWLGDHGAAMYMDYDGFGVAYCNCDGSCEGIGIRPVIEITKSVFE